MSVTDFRKTLTWESGVVRICSCCDHKLCPGRKLKLVSMCLGCGHKACQKCFPAGSEAARPKCCACGEEPGSDEEEQPLIIETSSPSPSDKTGQRTGEHEQADGRAHSDENEDTWESNVAELLELEG